MCVRTKTQKRLRLYSQLTTTVRTTTKVRQQCVRYVCFDEFTYISSFSSLFLFFTSRKFFSSSLSHLQQRRIKNEPRKTGDVVARARRARRSVSLFILVFLLGLLRLCLLLSLSLSLLIDFWRPGRLIFENNKSPKLTRGFPLLTPTPITCTKQTTECRCS